MAIRRMTQMTEQSVPEAPRRAARIVTLDEDSPDALHMVVD